jgi:bifunctional aspartokinase / homoserine dehydrogenase 1
MNALNIDDIAYGSVKSIKTVVDLIQLRDLQKHAQQEFPYVALKTVNLFIVGTGNVGSAFIEQIFAQDDYFASEYNVDFRIVALANTKHMFLKRSGIKHKEWKEALRCSGVKTDIDLFVQEMFSMNLPGSIFIDNTASEEISNMYSMILASRISIVTCNKIAASSSYDNYAELKKIAVRKGVHFRFESNVGAGLPIIQTISNLVRTGDEVHQIEAVLSGSLNFIFNSFCSGMKFSDAVLKALAERYTEPDPLIDLRGLDVSRKLLILAREAGMRLESSDVIVENYLPHPLPEKYEPAKFAAQMREYDAHFEKVRDNIVNFNRRMRVIARFRKGEAKIILREVDSTHPFFHLDGNDNVISILTKRYPSRPMIIKGAGAGADVTASGIFSDILSIVNS